MLDINQKNSFAAYMAQKNILSKDEIERVVNDSMTNGKTVVDLILERGLLTEEVLRDSLAGYMDMQLGDVPYGVSLDVYKLIDFKVSYRYRVVVYAKDDNSIRVVTDNPLDLEQKEILDFLGKTRKLKIELYVTTRSEFVDLLSGYQNLLIEAGELTQEYVEQLKNKFGDIGTVASEPKIKSEKNKADRKEETVEPEVKMSLEQAASTEEQLADLTTSTPVTSDEGYTAEQKSWLRLLQEKVDSLNKLQEIINTRDIPRIVAAMVHLAIRSQASDVHIEPAADGVRIRYRVDGVMKEIIKIDKKLQPALVSRIKILAMLKIDEHRVPQDGQFRVRFEGRTVDLRISSLPTVDGEKVVIRILDVSEGKFTLDELGLQGLNLKKVESNIHRSNGMILSTGPTGSGKSTTLFAILGVVSVPGVNVVTLEDPVEYHIPGVNQCQINTEIGFTFARGLRSILRQDPNIIMVGEIRDKETAELAVHASLTGHLVLSTLHTNDAPSAVPRLIDMGIEPFLITSSLALVMAQRLVRKTCEHCKSEIEIPADTVEKVKAELANVAPEHLELVGVDINNPKFYKGLGCDYCQNTGTKGRIAIYEVMEMTETIQDMAVKKVSGTEIFEQAVKEGMITMRQDGFLKAMQGITTVDEVFRVTTK